MKPEFITREQADRQYRDHGVVPARPCLSPTLLDMHGDVLGARDVNAIVIESTRMIAGRHWSTFHLAVVGNIDVDAAMEQRWSLSATTKAAYLAVRLEPWRYCEPRRSRGPIVDHIAIALIIPGRAPYLVDWSGRAGPPPPVTLFPRGTP